MAHRTPKINDTVKFTDQQQAILNDAVEQLMEAGGLTALTQAHFNEAMKIVAQRFINAALQGELKHHLTQEDENLSEEESSVERVENKRNGYSKKTLHGNKGDLEIQVPRDRKGTYVPRLVPKHSRHFNDFDDAIIDLYGRGLSTREISEFIRSQYHVEVSAEFISTVTEKVNDDVRQWQGRPLDSVYPVVFLTLCASISVRTASSRRWRFIWLSACVVTADAMCSACGFMKTKERLSGRRYLRK